MLWVKDSYTQKRVDTWLVGRGMIKKDGFLNIVFSSTVLAAVKFHPLDFRRFAVLCDVGNKGCDF